MPGGKLWTAQEYDSLLRAWDDMPAVAGEGERRHCERIHVRFTAYCGGSTARTERALSALRSVLVANCKVIEDYETTHDAGSWYALNRSGREQQYSVSLDQRCRYISLNRALFERIKRMRNRDAGVASIATTSTATPSPPPVGAKRQRLSDTASDAASDVNLRMPSTEWTDDELACLARAWRADVKEAQSRGADDRYASFSAGRNKRIFGRFVSLCGGSTTRSCGVVATKRQDLASSCEFIEAFNAARIPSDKSEWHMLPKAQRLAVQRTFDEPGHFIDMPKAVCTCVTRVMHAERAIQLATNGVGNAAANNQVQPQQQHGTRAAPSSNATAIAERYTNAQAAAYQEVLEILAGFEVQTQRLAELAHTLRPPILDTYDGDSPARTMQQMPGSMQTERRLVLNSGDDFESDASLNGLPARDARRHHQRMPCRPPTLSEMVAQLQNRGGA